MPYTRTYRTIVPLEPGVSADVLRWLTRESFERKAQSDCLRIISYRESTMPADDIPPKAASQLGKPADYYEWHYFEAQATNA